MTSLRLTSKLIPQQLGADDRLIICFAGRGIAENDDNGSTGYLLPENACADERNIFLDMATFRSWLGLIRCRHLLVILDCCFAGAFRWTKETRHVLRLPEKIYQQHYDGLIRHPERPSDRVRHLQ